jgi:antitoxin ChpS
VIETTSRLSSKRQLTLPAQMARALGLGAGSKVILRLEGNRITLIAAPVSYTRALGGALHGAYGPDVDAYVREERASWGES